MKITDYSKVTSLVGENILLIDGPDGTKTITASDLAKEIIKLLDSEDFISGVDMADLDQADTVLGDNNFLIGTGAGNKAVTASVLAKKLVGMLTSEEMVNGLTLSELAKTTTLEDTDHLLTGIEAGARAMTALDLAKALAKKLTSAELVAGLKLSELTATTTLSATDYLMAGLAAGNRAMTAKNMALALPKLLSSAEFISPLTMSQLAQTASFSTTDNILIGTSAGNKYMKAEDAFFAMLDAFGPPEIHRCIYRGKNLGTSVSAEQKAAIADGSFKGMFVGDYWVINSVNWRIADMDYFLRCGDTDFTKHHLVIVPDKNLYSNKMNDTNITTGGYVGSKMYTEYINQAKTTINAAFPGLVLTHKDYFVNAVTDGHPSAGAWVESTVELMNEIMVYGTSVFTPANNGVTIPTLYTTGKQQFALFMLNPKMVNTRESYWLRDVVSGAYFALVTYHGYAGYGNASDSLGVRPYFCVGS